MNNRDQRKRITFDSWDRKGVGEGNENYQIKTLALVVESPQFEPWVQMFFWNNLSYATLNRAVFNTQDPKPVKHQSQKITLDREPAGPVNWLLLHLFIYLFSLKIILSNIQMII